MKYGPRKYYKAINFDLNIRKLENDGYYRDYRQAYSEVAKFMKENSFEHAQYSGYHSINKISFVELNDIIDKFTLGLHE